MNTLPLPCVFILFATAYWKSAVPQRYSRLLLDWNVTGNCFDRNWGAGLCALKMHITAVAGNVFRRWGKDSRRLPEAERSCQVRLEECSGLACVSNVCAAKRFVTNCRRFVTNWWKS